MLIILFFEHIFKTSTSNGKSYEWWLKKNRRRIVQHATEHEQIGQPQQETKQPRLSARLLTKYWALGRSAVRLNRVKKLQLIADLVVEGTDTILPILKVFLRVRRDHAVFAAQFYAVFLYGGGKITIQFKRLIIGCE